MRMMAMVVRVVRVVVSIMVRHLGMRVVRDVRPVHLLLLVKQPLRLVRAMLRWMRPRPCHATPDLVHLTAQVCFLSMRLWSVVRLHVRPLIACLLDEAGCRCSELVLTAERRRYRPDCILGEIDDFLEVHDFSLRTCLGQIERSVHLNRVKLWLLSVDKRDCVHVGLSSRQQCDYCDPNRKE